MFGIRGIKQAQKLKDGGRVVGPGSGTSDSIEKEVAEGSYIMPADTTARLGRGVPGFNGNPKAKPSAGPALGLPGFRKEMPVNLSNGEFELTPEQVHGIGVQVLNSVKDATHVKVPGRGLSKGMRPQDGGTAEGGPELFFADGGLVDDPHRPRGLVFNPQRFQTMGTQAVRTAQADAGPAQPSPLTPNPQASGARGLPAYRAQTTPERPGVVGGLAGGAKAIAAGLALPTAAAVDAARVGATTLAGGDPDSLEGGRTKYRDVAMGAAQEGWDQASSAAEGLRESARSTLGVSPARGFVPASQRVPAPANTASPAAPGAGDSTGAARGLPAWRRTGIGADRQGGEIAGRVGANGVPEFTNEAATPGSVSGAAPGLGFGPTSRMARESQPGVGSIDNVGNGVGTFSQGEAGDAQLALGRFERANQIRGEAIANRPRELGDAGGRVTVVRDSSRTPNLADRMRARYEQSLAQTDALQAQTEQSGELARQQVSTGQLQNERLQQELATGQYSVQDRRRIADLQEQMVNPALSEAERNQAREAYTSLTTQAKDRYQSQDVILGRDESGKDIRGTQLIDVTTGRPVAGGAQPQRRASVSRAEVEQAAQEDGVSVDEYVRMLQAQGVNIG